MTPSTNGTKTTTIVLTGGPQGGKSTLLGRLAEDAELEGRLTVVPEAATLLFGGGHPTPTPTWTEVDWYCLELAVTSLQLSLEQSMGRKTVLTICDRAPFDNLAYPCGRRALEHLWGPAYAEQMSRYDLVLHMESLATAVPELFSRLANDDRYEDLEGAQALELRARHAWEGHPNWHFVSGTDKLFEDKLAEATKLVKQHLKVSSTSI